jgi:hypothetical protein
MLDDLCWQTRFEKFYVDVGSEVNFKSPCNVPCNHGKMAAVLGTFVRKSPVGVSVGGKILQNAGSLYFAQ